MTLYLAAASLPPPRAPGRVIAVVTEPVALGLIEAPGALGADIVVGEGQSIGVGLNFGGPYLGLFGCREKFVRQMPGRLCGETVDADGKRGFVLTLSTREHHIRRADQISRRVRKRPVEIEDHRSGHIETFRQDA